MFNWLKFERKSTDPITLRTSLGVLKVESGKIWIIDPQYVLENSKFVSSFSLGNIPPGEYPIEGEIVQYPQGGRRLARLEIIFSSEEGLAREEIGTIGVDSGTVILFDDLTHNKYWRDEGPNRKGVVTSPSHRSIAQQIRKEFGLKSKEINFFRSEILEPVSIELEEAITEFIRKSMKTEWPLIYFRVETGNTFEKILESHGTNALFSYLVMDDSTGAKLMTFSSGFGDGEYSIFGFRNNCGFSRLEVEFIGPKQENI